MRNLKLGFTTGTCAQATAKAASFMLVKQRLLKNIEIKTPAGIRFKLRLKQQRFTKDFACCAVVKDSAEEIDVTDGAKIYATARFTSERGVSIKGGEGVGRVTKPGLAVGVGEYAINPVPRKMILQEVLPYLPLDKGIEIEISVPEGKRLAQHTYNPRLGIVDGISIIGTSGLVVAKSRDAFQQSLILQLDVLKASGNKKVGLVLGYVGEKFCREKLKPEEVIKIGDGVGFMFSQCVAKSIKEVILIGHIGKLVKLAYGQFNTHFRFGDRRIETIAHFAKLCKADKKIVPEILKQVSAEACIDILKKNNLQEVFFLLAEKIVFELGKLSRFKLNISCILLSLKGEILGCYPRDFRL